MDYVFDCTLVVFFSNKWGWEVEKDCIPSSVYHTNRIFISGWKKQVVLPEINLRSNTISFRQHLCYPWCYWKLLVFGNKRICSKQPVFFFTLEQCICNWLPKTSSCISYIYLILFALCELWLLFPPQVIIEEGCSSLS